MPLAYEVFDGNRLDVTTVQEIVTTVEARFGSAKRAWVMDSGMASEENVRFLRVSGRRYLIGAARSDLKRYEARIAEEREWTRIRPDVEVKVCPTESGEETYILCRSEARREKDLAILDRFEQRLGTSIASLQRRIARARRPLDRAQIDQRCVRTGRRCARPWPAATCCAPTSRTGRRTSCGAPTSSSPTPRTPSARRRASSRSVPSGITARIEPRRTSSSSSWPTRCGRPLSCGKSGLASATARA
ncbi:MAG: transposase [Planctomycetes bacterium]|nr:transposase [Planctomycetota bacterium]